MEPFGLSFQRWILAGSLPLMAVVFWSGSSDAVDVPKMTVAALAAVLVSAIALLRVAVERRIEIISSPLLSLLGVLALALIAATAGSDVSRASVAGVFGRSDGLLLYLSCVLLLAAAARALQGEGARLALLGLLVGGAFAAGYGLLQKAGIDPISWADIGLSPVIGTFGNPDFEAGYLGIVIPAAAWGVVTRTWATGWRIAAAVLLVMASTAAVLTSALQGVVAAAAGLVVVGAAVVLRQVGPAAKRWLGAGAAGISLLLLGVMLLGLSGASQQIATAGSLTARRWYWSAALSMWRSHPVTGVGLDRYGAYYRAHRTAAAAAASNYSDAAHSVPLHLLATGGLLVALPYVAVTLLIAWLLVRGLGRLEGEALLLLGAVGGAWVAYQVQSLVSIDQPGLAVTGWILGGAVAALALPDKLHVRALPGALAPPARGKGRRPLVQQQPEWSGATYTSAGVITIVGLVAAWLVLSPIRASHASRVGAVSLTRGDGNGALAAMIEATRLAPYEQSYWLQRGRFLEQVRQPGMAMSCYQSGLNHDGRSYDLALAMGQLAVAQKDAAALRRAQTVLRSVDRSGRWKAALNG